MEIIWSQLVTNILGFLILFWGLKRFAWGPLLAMLDERRERIAEDFRTAATEREQAQAVRSQYEKEMREVETTARKKIEAATAEGNKLASDIKEEARQQARTILDKATADIEHERAKARVALRDDIVSMAVMGAEKILKERMAGDSHSQLVGRFIDELEESNA